MNLEFLELNKKHKAILDTGILVEIYKSEALSVNIFYASGELATADTIGSILFSPYHKKDTKIIRVLTKEENPEYFL